MCKEDVFYNWIGSTSHVKNCNTFQNYHGDVSIHITRTYIMEVCLILRAIVVNLNYFTCVETFANLDFNICINIGFLFQMLCR